MDLASSDFATPSLLCFFSHHRPSAELVAADLGFLSLARATGWIVKRVWKDKEAGVSSLFLTFFVNCSTNLTDCYFLFLSLLSQKIKVIFVLDQLFMDGLSLDLL